MPIGPRGEPLPYTNGGNINAGNIAAAGREEARGMSPVGGGNEMAAKNRLMEIAAEAEAIMTQFPHLAQELAGGGQNAQPATPVPEMPQMPVGGNTGGLGGGMPPGLLA